MGKKIILKGIEIFIREHLHDKQFCVDYISQKLEISHSYLREIIWMQYNVSPHKLVETIKLEIAIELIATSEYNNFQICNLTGYHNLKTFYQALKKRLQMTPGECKQIFKHCKDLEGETKNLKNALRQNFS